MSGDTNEERKFYVYAYLRTSASKNGAAGTPYYIGKGQGNRAYSCNHSVEVPSDRNNIQIIADEITEDEAFQEEIRLIKEHGRVDLGTGCLHNFTDGGEGVSGLSDERRRNLSEIQNRPDVIEANRARMGLATDLGPAVAINSGPPVAVR